jgi:hypothetical protein
VFISLRTGQATSVVIRWIGFRAAIGAAPSLFGTAVFIISAIFAVRSRPTVVATAIRTAASISFFPSVGF